VPYIRMVSSAVDPGEVDAVRQLFDEDVRPAFEALDGCLSVELLVNVETNAGGLIDGCAVTRWATREQMDAGLATRSAAESQVRLRTLLRQEPVTKTYETFG
jgi:quinol monooxygenase YgiN